jgi:acyl-CoA thioester hydrolase
MAEAVLAGTHMFPCRVYYEDTDAGGIVYYANYLRFAERARSELLRDMGTDNTTLLNDHGVIFAVRECTVRYREPARLDDALQIFTRIVRVGGASFAAAQRIERSGRLLADLTVRLACLDAEGRPARLPASLRSAFETRTEGH